MRIRDLAKLVEKEFGRTVDPCKLYDLIDSSPEKDVNGGIEKQ